MIGAAAQYLKEVNKNIICPVSLKKPFLQQLETEAQYFCEDHRDTSMEMLSGQFGTPEDVAEMFLTELGSRTLEHYKQRQRILCQIMAAVLLVSLAAAAFVVYDAYVMQQRLDDNKYVDSITYTVEPPYHP